MAKKADKKADILAGAKAAPRSRKARMPTPPIDRGEPVDGMNPMIVSSESKRRPELSDKVLTLTQRAAGFRSRIPPGLIEPLSGLVREMNDCYYSNLIEGHRTHPVDIQRALFGQESEDPKTRDRQKEAVAHICVQRWIDEGGIDGRSATQFASQEIHKRLQLRCSSREPEMGT